MKIRFETGLIEDIDEIAALAEAAKKVMQAEGNIQWGDAYPAREHFEADLKCGELIKAVDENNIIAGIATMNVEQSEEYQTIVWGSYEKAYVLHRLIVHPDYQNRKIGRKLTKYFEQRALDAGYAYLRLDAYSLNSAANRLYTGLGYQNRGTVYFRDLKAPFYCFDKFIGENIEMRSRLGQQMVFLKEADKMKSIYRQTLIMDGSRNENDAEHSWHLALMALLLDEHSNGGVDLLKVIKMVLIHDIVEIDAGDTFVYDEKGYTDKSEREERAAERLFGILPKDQTEYLIGLWHEFEARETKEAKFAASLDRIQPIINNFYTDGASWRKHGIIKSQVINKNEHTAQGSKELWSYAEGVIDESVKRGYLG